MHTPCKLDEQFLSNKLKEIDPKIGFVGTDVYIVNNLLSSSLVKLYYISPLSGYIFHCPVSNFILLCTCPF